MERLSGAIELVRDGITGTAGIVERMHFWVAGLSYGPVQRMPGIGRVAAGSRAGHDRIARLVYGTVRVTAEEVLTTGARLVRGLDRERGPQ